MASQGFSQDFDNTGNDKRLSFQETDMWKKAQKIARQLPNGFTVVSSDELIVLDDLLNQLDRGLTVAVNVNQDIMYAGYSLSAIGSRLVEILLSKPCTKEEKEEVKGLFGQINENTVLINKCYAKSYYEFGVEDEEDSEEAENDESES